MRLNSRELLSQLPNISSSIVNVDISIAKQTLTEKCRCFRILRAIDLKDHCRSKFEGVGIFSGRNVEEFDTVRDGTSWPFGVVGLHGNDLTRRSNLFRGVTCDKIVTPDGVMAMRHTQ